MIEEKERILKTAQEIFLKEGFYKTTIDDLAARFGTTPDELRRLNPELSDLTPGESLSVPPSPA